MRKLLINWIIVAVFAGGIFYLSSTQQQIPVNIPYIDLVAHFVFYSVLAYLISRAVFTNRLRMKKSLFVFVVIVATAYGIVIEIIQMHIPTREASITDGVANFLGSASGAFLYMRYRKFRKNQL